VLSLALGWGRGPEAGQVAAGPSGEGVGVNALDVIPYVKGQAHLNSIPVSYVKTGRSMKLACTQGHQYLENDLIRASGEGHRKIVQDAFLEQFNDDNDVSWTIAAHHHAPTDVSIWRQKYKDSTHKWAMVIDTNVCSGCNSCVVSCQAENNIPVVGKDEVLLNREMHWLRIDRYYTAVHDENPEQADDVDVINQPMMCQHCDNAPCETVCPVIATSHNEEGLNVQTYNRCVGTRYCSNNCPYKVRHYNWYDYSDYRAGVHDSGRPLKRFLRQLGVGEVLGLGKKPEDKTEYPLMLQLNPDVTVRSRGVMEKCSWCIQEIRRWHQEEQALGRELPESQKQLPCQTGCAADAITFGNMLDENSSVSKAMKKRGSYKVLDELNVKSNVTYLTRIKNREMPEHAKPHDSHGGGHDEHSGEPAHH
jgi:molybdopterin-containing oxidoreductase family iron-sulfur binding subunit